MKRSILVILAVCLCAGTFAQKEKAPLITWHDSVIDNFLSVPITYSERGKFYYSFTNDEENLYVLLKVFDKDIQRQVLISGFTIWFNMEGKKAKKTGIRYPARDREGGPGGGGMGNQQMPLTQGQAEGNIEAMQGGMPGGQGQMGGRNANDLLITPKIEAIGLSAKGNEFFAVDGTAGYKGSMKFEKDGNLFCQIIIPISKIPPRSEDTKKGADGFLLGISYPGVSYGMSGGMPGGGGFDQGGGRGGGGGMGGPGGGGRSMGGRGGSPSMEGGSSSASPVVIWFKDMRFATHQ
jgi:hypothetical protein